MSNYATRRKAAVTARRDGATRNIEALMMGGKARRKETTKVRPIVTSLYFTREVAGGARAIERPGR